MLKSGVVLKENETLVMELEAELWAKSSNPIARFLGSIYKLIALILGIKRHGYVVITDQRVIEVTCVKSCWIFDTSKKITYIMPASIKEVGYTKEATFLGCFCHAYTLYYEGWTQGTSVLLKGADEKEAQRIVEAFYHVLNK
jgi:hypothetical protein